MNVGKQIQSDSEMTLLTPNRTSANVSRHQDGSTESLNVSDNEVIKPENVKVNKLKIEESPDVSVRSIRVESEDEANVEKGKIINVEQLDDKSSSLRTEEDLKAEVLKKMGDQVV